MAEYRGLQSLPGGFRNYTTFILKVLAKISSEQLQRTELLDWVKDEFALKGIKAPKWYIHTLLALNLVKEAQGGLFLTEDGKKFLATKDNEIILKKLLENFAGIKEILIFLSEKGWATLADINEMLRSECGFTWITNSQTSRRLMWLRALDYVEFDGKRYHLTEKGKKSVQGIL